MKINFLRESIFVALAAALLVACGGRNNMSRATGWGINSKDGGFQYNIEFEDQENGPGLVFIEGGTYTKGQVQDDVFTTGIILLPNSMSCLFILMKRKLPI